MILLAFQSYEAAFDKIKKTTKIDDIDLLVEIFIEVEDKNFALFNYVNELNNEIEMLQEGIAGIENDVEQFKRESVELEQQRKDILWQLEVSPIFLLRKMFALLSKTCKIKCRYKEYLFLCLEICHF